MFISGKGLVHVLVCKPDDFVDCTPELASPPTLPSAAAPGWHGGNQRTWGFSWKP